MICRNLFHTGQYEAALKNALNGIELAKRIGEGILSMFFFVQAGQAALYAERIDYALELLKQGESEGERLGHPLGLAYIRVYIAEALLRLDRCEEAAAPADAALRFCQALDLGPFLQTALQINAEILAYCDPSDKTRIDEMMEQATALVERGNSPWMRIQYLMTRARIGLKRGRIEDARKDLAEARALYLEMGLENGTGELRSIEKALKEADV